MKLSKSALAIILSKLNTFNSQKVRVEQYSTDSEIAATMIWLAYQYEDLLNKEIIDLGAGTGILGLGTMLFGPKKVIFVDEDIEALEILKKNLKFIKSEYSLDIPTQIIHSDVKRYNDLGDTVIMNPPFGTRIKHADKDFLTKSFDISKVVYSLHKTQTKEFIKRFAESHDFQTSNSIDVKFPIKNTISYHKSRIKRIDTTIFRFFNS